MLTHHTNAMRFFCGVFGAMVALSSLLATAALAQYPNKPIRVLVPIPPAKSTDVFNFISP